MVYCSVPYCKSKQGKTVGVSFHEFPFNVELRQNWLKNVSRQGEKCGSKWNPTDASRVCSRHFTEQAYSKSTTRRRLLPHAVPTVFEDYPPHKQPPANTVKRIRNVYSSLLREQVQEVKHHNIGREEVTEDEEGQTADKGIQVSVILRQKQSSTMKTVLRKNRLYKKRIASLKSKVSVLKAKLKSKPKVPASTLDKQLNKVVLKAGQGCVQASFLKEQLEMFGKKKPKYSVLSLKLCILLHRRSPKAYRFLRQMKMLRLPHRITLKRYMGFSNGEIGITSLVRSRLLAEAKVLTHKNERMGSLILDEMAIQPKLLYDRKLDQFLGQTSTACDVGVVDQLANRMLCFLFRGLSRSYKIPVAFFFTNSLTAIQLKDLTLEVIKAVEEQGFIVVRIVADNLSVNTSMFKLLSNGRPDEPMIIHPFDSQRHIFLSFDPSHVIKNVRSQFLSKTMAKNDDKVTSVHLKRLYKHQQSLTGIVKPVRFLTRKHLYPNNLEKMNVLRAVQIFSPQLTSALLTMSQVAPEKVEDHKSLQETVNFLKIFHKWFNLHDICNQTQAIYSRMPDKAPFSSSEDSRLNWLMTDFLTYIKEIQTSPDTNDRFSDETYHALCFTTKSTVFCIKFLFKCGFEYVLTRHFSGDDIEALFSHVRQMGGYHDTMDAKSCLHAMETTLKTGVIASSVSANVAGRHVETGNLRSTPVNEESTQQTIYATEERLPMKQNQNCETPTTFSLPSSTVDILEKIHQPACISANLESTTIAMIGGYLARVAQETVNCTSCLEKLITPKSSTPLNLLIFNQDRGGLIYPQRDFIFVLQVIADFVSSALREINIHSKKIRRTLESMILPHLLKKFKCTSCENQQLQNLLVTKYLNPILDNWAKSITDKIEVKRKLVHKPLSRKVLKLS